LIDGSIVPSARLDEAQRAAAAEPLARFLAALHAITAEQAAQLGAEPDTIGRLDLHKRVPRAREHLEKISRLGLVDEPESLGTVLDETVHRIEAHEASTHSAPSLVHGDLDARHLLVDGQGEPCGVIDWGDVHMGDPAVDLAIAHSFLPPSARETFRSAYGPIDDRTWQLARFRALYQALLLVTYSHDIGDDDVLRESLTALRYAGGVRS
jgi:aminoglycoside phosphotransferase (APT) family kinase protein